MTKMGSAGAFRTAPLLRNALLHLCLVLIAGVFPITAAAQSEESAGSPAGQTAPSTDGEPQGATPAGDPPARVVRLGVLNGNASTEAPGGNTFAPAELNEVLTSGDRIYTDPAGGAELQAGQLAVRLSGGADLTVTSMTDALAQFGLAAGSAHLRSYALDPGTALELDTPDAAISVLRPGDLRVDVDAAAHTTTITLDSGQAQVDGPGTSQLLVAGERIRIHGGDPDTGETPFAESLAPAAADDLDTFSSARDEQYASGADAESPYLSLDTVGSADLASYGSWDTGDDGPVWYPTVAVSWQPYRFGHWCYVAPWGWTWVGAEPWAFAPFHYGRWALLNGRWGWIPGPRIVPPVYAPALVVFAGGAQFSATLGYGPGAGGSGVTAWFPLGPHEAYTPPYRGSTLYVNRVNVSNLYDPNAAQVRSLYNERARTAFGNEPGGPPRYANRVVGTIAVPGRSFVAGRPVAAAVLPISAETLASAPLLPRPPVSPARATLPGRPALALPPHVAGRPALAGTQPGSPLGSQPGSQLGAHRPDDAGRVPLFHRPGAVQTEGLRPDRGLPGALPSPGEGRRGVHPPPHEPAPRPAAVAGRPEVRSTERTAPAVRPH